MRSLLFFLLVAVATASPPMSQPERPTQPARVVLDSPPNRCHPKCFRTSAQLAQAYPGDKRGLSELRASGSASFSQAELALMKEHFNGPVVVVDLRQESHALVNGEPVTWYADNDWGNLGRSNAEVKQLEQEQLSELPSSLDLSPAKADDEGTTRPFHFDVHSRQSEGEVVEALGMGYFRLYVTDHLRPSDGEVDRFLAFLDLLPPDTWLHFHCRGGKGRTTTFLALYDMLRNAHQVEFQEIVKRQMALPPTYNLLAERSQSPRHVYYQERAQFVRKFYQFARNRPAGLSWSLWSQSH